MESGQIEKKRQQRKTFLRALYGLVDGREGFTITPMQYFALGSQIGLDRDVTGQTVRFLVSEGLLAHKPASEVVAFTRNGVAEVERQTDEQTSKQTDEYFARMAVAEARLSVPEPDGRTHPKVGVVIVKEGRVLAKAHRGEFPSEHAEFIALERKLSDVSIAGATVYATLEPCTARTQPKVPCAERLAGRKVARVFIGMLDPNPNIRGMGQIILSEANIETQFFPRELMAEVEELNRDFIREQKRKSVPTGRIAGDQRAEIVPSLKGEEITEALPALRPRIVAVRYRTQSSDNRSGLFLVNEGESAYDINISNIQFGTSKLVFHVGEISRLVKLDGEHLCETWIERKPGDGLLGNGLFHEMVLQRVDGIEISIRYKDGDNVYYIARRRIERDVRVRGGIVVRYLGQELTVSPASEIIPSANDPRIRVEVTSVMKEEFCRETHVILHNEGGGTAYRVKVENIDLSGSKSGKAVASFPTEESIPSQHLKAVLPEIDSQFSSWASDLVPFLKWSAESSPEPRYLSVTYYDYAGNRFQTTAEVVYVPLAGEDFSSTISQFHRKNVVEVIAERKERRAAGVSEIAVSNHRFRKVFTAPSK
jgi:pyrimidine deaminase RibD-like protein